jgi:hypothetical protein
LEIVPVIKGFDNNLKLLQFRNVQKEAKIITLWSPNK